MLLDDPVLALFRFHQQARSMLGELQTLAEVEEWGPKERASSEQLAWFLCGPLSWHDLDEEASVNRRLRLRATHDVQTLEALERIREQHDALEDAAETLVLALENAGRGEDIALSVGLFARILSQHLKEEEKNIFPAARALLTLEDLAEIAAEIDERAQRRKAHRPAAVHLKEGAAL